MLRKTIVVKPLLIDLDIYDNFNQTAPVSLANTDQNVREMIQIILDFPATVCDSNREAEYDYHLAQYLRLLTRSGLFKSPIVTERGQQLIQLFIMFQHNLLYCYLESLT